MKMTANIETLVNHLGTQSNILDYTIGRSNIILFELKDIGKADLATLKEMDEIIEVLQQENSVTLHVEEGVTELFREAMKAEEAAATEEPEEKKNMGTVIMDAIQGIFAPILAPLAGAGILQGLTIILVSTGLIVPGNAEEGILNTISGAVFYFMPILLAFSSAKVFGASPYLAATVAGILVHPTLVEAMQIFDIDFFRIPIQSINYANSVIPIILIVWFQSYLERGLKKVVPDILESVLNPLLVLVITAIVGLAVLGPLGNLVGSAIAGVLGYFTETVPWLVPTLMGALSPFVIMGGVHYSLFPAATLSLTELGYETILGPGMLAANMAHAGVALAVALRTKKTAYRSYSISAAVTATMGVSQPALYGIELILKRPLYAAIIGGGLGGLYAGIFNVRAYAFANPSLPALPIYLDAGNNIIHAVIMMVIAFVAGFFLTIALGFEEPSDEVVESATA